MPIHQRLNKNYAYFNNQIDTRITRLSIIIVRLKYRVKTVANSVVILKVNGDGKDEIYSTKKQ
jgi:hypothetical protein